MFGYRDSIQRNDGDQKQKDDYKDKSGLYVPPGNCDAKYRNSRMETFLVKLVKGLESQENFLKEIRAYISGMRQKFESHGISIK